MKNQLLLTLIFWTLLISICLAQGNQPHYQRRVDPKHSVFGPPRAAEWEFQISSIKYDGESASSFNFYRKNQRNKTLFLRVMDNGLNIKNEFRVRQLTCGASLFPYKNDDRFQVDIGGTYDALKDTSLTNKIILSRITFRPKKYLWFRVGYESFNGFTTSYQKENISSNYFVAKVNAHKFSVLGLVGTGKIDDISNTRYGAAGIYKGPFNTYVLGGYIKSSESSENVRTLAVGRWAPFRPDKLPSGFFIWKHKDSYDFQLGGIFWGGKNLFVRPAALGMVQGIYISSAALRENRDLRKGQLMTITDDYRNAAMSLFYVYLNQDIVSPNGTNHIGFKAVQLFRLFNSLKLSSVSKPVVGIFYTEETEPDRTTYPLVDKTIKYWSFQVGVTLLDRFILNMIQTPDKSEWTIALSFLYR